MDKKQNEFKVSALRNFGTENISFTATILSENSSLTPEEIKALVANCSQAITEAFHASCEREISEKSFLVENSHRRAEAVQKLDEALAEEIKVKQHAGKTIKEAEKEANKPNSK